MLREFEWRPSRIALWAAGLAAARVIFHFVLRAAHDGYTFLLSPTEIERTRVALAFAAEPSFAPLGILYWLPLQFWLEGSILRLWPDALAVPFVVNTAASAMTVAGVVLWTSELAGKTAALAAGAGVLLSASGLILGVGGSADPLAHAAAVWALFFWARFENSGLVSHAWWCAACLSLAMATRYESWFITAALIGAAVLSRRRAAALPLAAACLFPAIWAAYNLSTGGAPWAFVTQTSNAEIRNLSHPVWRLGFFFLSDFIPQIPPWLMGLTFVSLVSGRLPRSYWLVLGSVVLFFIAGQAVAMTQVDWHHWIVYLLALPAAGAAVASWISGLPVARRRASAAGAAILLIATQAVPLFEHENYYKAKLAEVNSIYMRLRSLRHQGLLTTDDAILVELPTGPRRNTNQYRLWVLEPHMRGLHDRRFIVDHVGTLDLENNDSALDLPRARLADWLEARRVRVIVASSERAAALAALGWKRTGRPLETGIWCAAGDPLERRLASGS